MMIHGSEEETQLGDLNPVLERIVALRQSIIEDGIANGVPFHVNDLKTLVERLKSEGSSFIKVTLPILGKALDQALISGAFNCPAGFRLKRDSRLPSFLGGPLGVVFQDDGVIRSQPSLLSVFFLRQFLLLDSKLISEPTQSQRVAAQNGFICRQALLKQRRIPTTHPVLLRAKMLLTQVLSDLSLDSIHPGHGPGATAEKLDRAERWALPSWPSRAERFYPYSEYASPSFVGLCSTGSPEMVKDSTTRFCLVPKDYKGPRLISAESTATQYLQQGQMHTLMEYIDNHWLLSRSIRLRDQTFNQRKCEEAYERGHATLDLSNASDNVSAALVWFLFGGNPGVRRRLFATRSQYISIDGTRHKLYSFAPMGSAVCFPVETLVFWALTLASLRHVYAGIPHTRAPGLRESASEVAVFGDDIIVPDIAFSTLVGTLQEVGCEVNTSKTCVQTPFRESCGSEWYNGTDISITRNRRYDYDTERRINDYPAILDLQRKFFLQGLWRAAALCTDWARLVYPVTVLGIRECRPPDGERSVAERSPWFNTRESAVRLRNVIGMVNKPVSQNRRRPDPVGSATALPSGLDFYVRNSASFDGRCVAIGWDTSLDCGVPTRWNQNYQRTECRLPTVFQCCRQWDHSAPCSVTSPDTPLRRGVHGMVRSTPKIKAILRLNTGYPRLLARLLGDYIERIAIRGQLRHKMAWSEIPRIRIFQS